MRLAPHFILISERTIGVDACVDRFIDVIGSSAIDVHIRRFPEEDAEGIVSDLAMQPVEGSSSAKGRSYPQEVSCLNGQSL